MSLQNSALELFIKMIANPFSRFKPIDFKSEIKEAKNILIYCPYSYTILSDTELRNTFSKFFDKIHVQLIDPNAPVEQKQKTSNLFFTFLNLETNQLFKAIKSEQLQTVLQIKYDYYIDISPEINKLNTYIAHKVNTPLKISANSQSPNLFNLNYQIHSIPDKKERLITMIQFLEKLSH